ncbi:ArsR/SmtB family transcription factor [Paenibacillus turpanensis]|uniref:ArsR/SmtB family transcription factor n=1 Tax=Paenibacillus turpanensis TaxID=2689078 RepID=UPI0014092662|nr:ArsR family transcriptional regulator [Paenibacillus turpanensis]
MIKSSVDPKWLPLYEALASEVRLKMIELLAEQPMNNKDLAARLGLSAAIVSMHVKKLQQAGIITSNMIRLEGGTHKVNSLAVDGIEISLPQRQGQSRAFHEVSVPVGHYTQFDVHPTCGLATTEKLIGQLDDPRYFLHPERMHANILWLGKGFVEYKVPNYLLPSQRVSELELALEIGSEAPGVNRNWPSDIRFYVNGVDLGYWTSPGDSGEGRGAYSPDWWRDEINQYGFLKVIRVGPDGTYIDGERMSDTTIEDLPLERNQWTLRFAVEEDAVHVGGMTLYGAGFGNYNQDVIFRVYYEG